MMSGKGLLSEERIAFLVNGAIERGSQSAIEWAIRQAVAEAGEEAAKECERTWKDAPNTRLDSFMQNQYSHGCKASAAAIRRRVGR